MLGGGFGRGIALEAKQYAIESYVSVGDLAGELPGVSAGGDFVAGIAAAGSAGGFTSNDIYGFSGGADDLFGIYLGYLPAGGGESAGNSDLEYCFE